MENISELIKEAKPLYFARKRRNSRIKSALALVVCLVVIGGFYPRSYTYNYAAEAAIDNEIYLTETGSIIEDMGFPTDEYGLLMVS